MLLPPSVPTLSSPVAVPPNPTGPSPTAPGSSPAQSHRAEIGTNSRSGAEVPTRPDGAPLRPWSPPGAGQLVMAGERGDQLGRAAATAKQLAHMRLGAAQGLQRRHALQRL